MRCSASRRCPPHAGVTVLLGSASARQRIMAQLDDNSGRCPAWAGCGRPGCGRCRSGNGTACRQRGREAGGTRCGALRRRADRAGKRVHRRIRAPGAPSAARTVTRLATTGRAILVDDIGPVAALAVASAALRVEPAGEPGFEPVGTCRGAELPGLVGQAVRNVSSGTDAHRSRRAFQPLVVPALRTMTLSDCHGPSVEVPTPALD